MHINCLKLASCIMFLLNNIIVGNKNEVNKKKKSDKLSNPKFKIENEWDK